jgi:nucleoside phosphorylase
MIAVTFALPAESSAFLRRLGNKSRSRPQGIKTIHGKIQDRTIEVFHTGVGEKTCRYRMASFLQDRRSDCLISAGFAGALNDRLRVGDLVLAKNFSTLDPSKVRSCLAGLSVHVADLLTVPAMIDSVEERRRIAQTTGASAVDMETEFISRACAQRGIPMLSLRVISDSPASPFPAPSMILFDILQQRTDMTKFVSFFLTHPNRLPRLVQFARGIAGARNILADALVDLAQNL